MKEVNLGNKCRGEKQGNDLFAIKSGSIFLNVHIIVMFAVTSFTIIILLINKSVVGVRKEKSKEK